MSSTRACPARLALVFAALIVFCSTARAQDIVLEAETLRVLAEIDTTGARPEAQQMGVFGRQWSNNAHLWFRAERAGQSFRANLPVANGASYQILAHFTKAPDYGIVQVSLDGKPIGQPFDAYAVSVSRSDAIDLGRTDLTAGDHVLTFKVTGKNGSAVSYMAGVDVIILRPAQFVVVPIQTAPQQPTQPSVEPKPKPDIGKVIADIAGAALAAKNRPDLKPLTFDPAHAERLIVPFPPVAGEQTAISVDFINAGKGDVTSEFSVDLYIDGQLHHRWTYGPPTDPLPLKRDKWQHYLESVYLPAGPHEIKIVVDPDNKIVETDESRESNWLVYTTEWREAGDLPDLVIESMSHEGPLVVGAKQKWVVKVVNEGKSGTQNQCFLQLARGDGKLWAGQVSPLPPQAFQNVFVETDPIYDPKEVRWTATVDYDFKVRETSDSNNTKEASFQVTSPHVPLQVAKLSFASSQQAGTPPTNATRKFAPHPIDTGALPPNFVHTWLLALKAIDSFTIGPSATAKLNFPAGDRLTVLDATGTVLATYASAADLKSKTVNCAKADVKDDDVDNYTRLYLALETSNVETSRSLQVFGLTLGGQPTGDERALVLEDEIDYSAPADAQFLVANDSLGNPITLYSPWWGDTSPTAGESGGSAAAYPKPNPGEGWYLAGSNLASPFGMTATTPSRSFYTLVYYNENDSRLRIYLNNWEIPENLATGFAVEISLLGRVGTGPSPPLKQLKGAFFPIDPNPENWSTAKFVFKTWPIRTWRFIEIPMLYPTAQDLALAAKTKEPNYAIYEEQLRNGARNVRVQVTVTAFQQGNAQMSLEGQAVGKAVQDITNGGQDTFDIMNVYEAFKKGYDWYSTAKGFSDTVQKNLDSLGGLKEAAKWAARGASCFAGPIGIAGAAISILTDLLSGGGDADPIKMQISLSLTGKIEGTIDVPGTPCKTWFYLPGRFSIQDAFQPLENLPKGDQRLIASRVPRYDRTMGLFGYAYNPGSVVMDFAREDHYDNASASRMYFVSDWTTPYKPQDLPWRAKFQPKITGGRILPVIYNPYAGVTPISLPSPTSWTHVLYTTDLYDAYGPHEITSQWRVPYYNPGLPQTYKGFKDTLKPTYSNPEHLTSAGWQSALTYLDFSDKKHDKGWSKTDWKSFEVNNLYPLRSIMQYYDCTYDHLLRNGQKTTSAAHLWSPISVNLVRWIEDTGELYRVKSEIMQGLTLKDLGQ